MYASYLTGLFGLAHEDEWLYVIVHIHMFSAGWLISTVVAGRDPLPRRPELPGASIMLLIADAAPGILAKLMYAHSLPALGGKPAQCSSGTR